MEPEPDHREPPTRTPERGAGLALLPIAATLGFYALPASLQDRTLIQFMPQLLAYGALALWGAQNSDRGSRLGLTGAGVGKGLCWGLPTGLVLGAANTAVILAIVPSLGYDVGFLKDTPHGRLPVLVMAPWFICGIALCVEVNFRGFLLGRLAALESRLWRPPFVHNASPIALLASALTFTFDPFMVNTFRHLHWIALWDGLIWGAIWLHTRNLWITITAHAVEVLVMYLAVRTLFASE
jgi:membrane protease YdiL (CAAX protease family)